MSKRYRRKSIKISKKILLLFFAILIAILAVILTRTQNSSSAQVAQQRKGLTEEQIEELKDSIMVEEVNNQMFQELEKTIVIQMIMLEQEILFHTVLMLQQVQI